MLCFALAFASCGNPGEDPLPVTRSSTGSLMARASVCAVEVMSIDGAIRASVTPASLFLELRRETCDNPGSVAAASPTGRLAQNVRAGVYHVRVINPSDATLSYALTVDYTMPSL